MHPDKLVPMMLAADLPALKDFYTSKLGFEVTWDSESYLGLRAGDEAGPELSFMTPCDEQQPLTDGRGVTYCLQVADVDAEHERLAADGVTVVQPPKDNPWGDRSCIVLDPLGISLYVYSVIEVDPEFKQYVQE